MDKLYRKAVEDAKERSRGAAEGAADVLGKRGAEGVVHEAKKPKKVCGYNFFCFFRLPPGVCVLGVPMCHGMFHTSCVSGCVFVSVYWGMRSLEQHGGGEKNIPAHRGAFKRHLRKHTLLFQREGGETAKVMQHTRCVLTHPRS
jgi:hypothetical protein